MIEFYQYGYIGLFTASFLSATILPFSSEAILTLFLASDYDTMPCIAVASTGNWLGGMSTYYLGYIGKWDWIEKFLRISHQKVNKMQEKLNSKSGILAFFAFLPIIGDIIPLCLGLSKSKIFHVAIFMAIGKILRYIVWAYLSLLVIR